MATYYVATNGSNLGDGSANSPWLTINYAMRADLKPGDEVIVREGTYNQSVLVSKDGAAGQYITIRSEVPGGAKIVPPAGKPGINVNADYVTVAGFDVSGSTVTGITATKVHHVKVEHNFVHDNEANGIFLGESDYIKVEDNIVYNNAAKGTTSGIHIKAAYNVTGDTTTTANRIIVRDNVVFDNKTEYGPKTDGNGISIDDLRNTQRPDLPAYQYRTLVENNITYSNSGRGVQIAWSDNVIVRGNLAFYNSTEAISGPWRGEIANMGSSNNRFIDNIAVVNPDVNPGNTAISNTSFAGDPANTNVTWTGNQTFNGTPGATSVHANAGNSRPLPANNQLGVDPGLSLEEVKELGEDLPGWTYPDPPDVTPDPEPLPGEVFTGTAGADTLIGTSRDDTLNGNNGADNLNGGGGQGRSRRRQRR